MNGPFTGMAAVGGGQLHYRIEGPADAPVLMLSHSLGTDHRLWDPQVPTLAARFRVLRYDARGHGASDPTPGPYRLEELAQDALGLLDALRVRRAHFCGLSMGGAVGMWLGVNAPARLDRLVLCNTAARFGSPAVWDARVDAVRAGGMAAIVDGVLGRWFTPAFLAAGSGEVAHARAMLLATSPEGYAATCAALRDADQRATLSRISVPTLVIGGSHDGATPPCDGRFLAESIPPAAYVELPTAHLSNLEAPATFTARLLGFLGEGPHPQGGGPS